MACGLVVRGRAWALGCGSASLRRAETCRGFGPPDDCRKPIFGTDFAIPDGMSANGHGLGAEEPSLQHWRDSHRLAAVVASLRCDAPEPAGKGVGSVRACPQSAGGGCGAGSCDPAMLPAPPPHRSAGTAATVWPAHVPTVGWEQHPMVVFGRARRAAAAAQASGKPGPAAARSAQAITRRFAVPGDAAAAAGAAGVRPGADTGAEPRPRGPHLPSRRPPASHPHPPNLPPPPGRGPPSRSLRPHAPRPAKRSRAPRPSERSAEGSRPTPELASVAPVTAAAAATALARGAKASPPEDEAAAARRAPPKRPRPAIPAPATSSAAHGPGPAPPPFGGAGSSASG